MSEEVWYRVVQIVINRQEVQGYAAKTCYQVRSTCTCTVHVHCTFYRYIQVQVHVYCISE